MKYTSGDEAGGSPGARENRCVWMEAGILSYLLCDREYECEECPLDEAMRCHYSGSARRAAPAPEAATDGSPRPEESALGYSPAHMKVVFLEGGRCRVFVEPGVAKLLPPVRSVVLPRNGDRISPDGFCCWLIFEGGTLPVKLPFGATAGGGNPQLAERPHLVNQPASDDAWLFDFTPDDRKAACGMLMSASIAVPKYDTDQELFRRLMMGCLRPDGASVGQTFQDGGRFVDDLATLIGPVKYLGILRRVFWLDR